MKSNQKIKLNRDLICLIAYGAVFVISALGFWLFCPPDAANVYTMVVLWLVMPLASVLFSYMLAIAERPRGWKRLAPIICGAALMLLEYVTLSLKNMIAFPGNVNTPSITLAIFGIVASLIGFCFAKQDRKENSKTKNEAKIVVEEEAVPSKPEDDSTESDADRAVDALEADELNEQHESDADDEPGTADESIAADMPGSDNEPEENDNTAEECGCGIADVSEADAAEASSSDPKAEDGDFDDSLNEAEDDNTSAEKENAECTENDAEGEHLE